MSQFYSETVIDATAFGSSLTGVKLIHASENGYTEIYKAQYCGRWLVFKRLTDRALSDKRYQILLKKEFDISFPLSSPNIVQTFSYELIKGLGTCIVTEYIDGLTWDQYFAQPEILQTDTLRIVNELLDALIYLHQRQIVHRDIKPQNIIITHDGHHPKLIDFGLADCPLFSILKEPAGTTDFIAPEQVESAIIDCRFDIYSLGHLLELLHLPTRYDKVIERCLAPLDRRFQSVVQVKEALAQVDQHRRRHRIWGMGLVGAILQILVVSAAWMLGRTESTDHNNDNGVSLSKQIALQYDAETRDSITIALERFMKQEPWIRSTISNSMAQRDSFVTEFSISKLKTLPRDEYSIDNKRGFTYRLKYNMDWMGAFYDVDSEPYECNGYSDSLYQQQLDNIVKLLNDGAIGDKKAIAENPLYPPLKYRLLTVYYPKSTYMPFWLDREVNHFLNVLLPSLAVREQLTPVNCIDGREILFNYKNAHPIMKEWDNFMFMDFLFMYFPKHSAVYNESQLRLRKA